MKIITISGLDGSGKSTQIQLLKKYLESQNKRVFYFHAIQFGLANKISSKFFYRKEKTELKGKTKSGKFGIFLRKIFLKIDLCRFEKLIEKLEKEKYDYLVSDRYFYDGAVNLAYLENNCHPEFISGSNLKNQEMLKQVQHDKIRLKQVQHDKKILRPDIAIYLQTDPEIIMQRERKPDQGFDYLKKKKEIYDEYASVWNLKTINGNRNKEEVFEEISSHSPFCKLRSALRSAT